MKCSKKLNRLLILGCVLAAACAATFAVMHHEKKMEKIRASEEIILQIPTDSVTGLSWTQGEQTLSFHREESWLWDDDPAFPVNQEKIRELLDPFQEFGVAFAIDDVEDFSQYGLDTPVCTIRITTEDETEYEITLGDFSAMDAQRYVAIGDGRVYLVSRDPMDLFDADIRQMIDHDEDLAYNRVYEIRFSGKENYTVTYQEDSEDAVSSADVYFTQHGGARVPLDTKRVGTYLESMTTLNPYDYVNYKATEEDLPKYGLDNPELTVSVDYDYIRDDVTTNGTFVIHVGRDPEKLAEEAAREAEEGEDYEPKSVPAYVRMGDSAIIYQITQSEYDALMAASFNDLRHQEVFAADFEDVTAMDVTLEGSTRSFTRDEEGLWFFGEKEIDIAPVQSALTALTAAEFTEDAPGGREEISLTVHLDNQPQITIRLSRYDGASCLASVNGEPFALVERSAAVELVEAVNAIVLAK